MGWSQGPVATHPTAKYHEKSWQSSRSRLLEREAVDGSVGQAVEIHAREHDVNRVVALRNGPLLSGLERCDHTLDSVESGRLGLSGNET